MNDDRPVELWFVHTEHLIRDMRTNEDIPTISTRRVKEIMKHVDRAVALARERSWEEEYPQVRKRIRLLRGAQGLIWLIHSSKLKYALPSGEVLCWILKAMRSRAGLTQQRLAEVIGVSASFVAAVESEADERTASSKVLVRWADACGFNIGMVFTPKNENPTLDPDDGVARLFVSQNAHPDVRTVADALNRLLRSHRAQEGVRQQVDRDDSGDPMLDPDQTTAAGPDPGDREGDR